MPRKPIDYSKTLIYKIVCNDLDVIDVYVGTTTDFVRRKSAHRALSRKRDFKIYQVIREHGGWDNWCMVEIEKFPCNDGNEARARERYYYELLHASLNTIRPIVSIDEKKKQLKDWNKTYNEAIRDRNKKYKEIIKDKKREYYEANGVRCPRYNKI